MTKKNKTNEAQRKPEKRRYYDVYSDDGVESGDQFSKSGIEEIVKKKKKAQIRKRTVAKTTTESATKKEEKTTERNYRLYKHLIVIK